MACAPLLTIFGSHYWGTHCTRDGPAWLRVFLVYLAQTRSWFPLPFSRYHCSLLLLRTHHPSHRYHHHHHHHYYRYCLLPHHTPSCGFFSASYSLFLSLPLCFSRSPAFGSVIFSDRASNLRVARCKSTIRSCVSTFARPRLRCLLDQRIAHILATLTCIESPHT
ncbi:hypothetical protein GGR55DRAFT_192652 [Xylaria sp. FL0064]|nr:hypothetical protein GGR55DRAFT_192652 [Xylaria sp. FL0064]